MKKIYFLALMGVAGTAFAQTGKVGINAVTPAATLDIQPSNANADAAATTNEGILIPRLNAARVARIAAPVEGTMVYVTDAPSTSKFSDTTKGFYYWDSVANTSGQWVKMGSGGNATAEGTFTRNIRQDNRTTVVVDQLQDGITPNKDYFIVMTGNPTALTMPAVASNVGRTICAYNPGVNGTVINPQPIGAVQSVDAGQTACFISNGTNWINSNGY